MTGRVEGVRESAVKWSGKNEFLSGKSQGISFQTKSGHPVLGSLDVVLRQQLFQRTSPKLLARFLLNLAGMCFLCTTNVEL